MKQVRFIILLLLGLGTHISKAQTGDARKLIMAYVLKVNPPNDKRLTLLAPFDAPDKTASMTSTPFSKATGNYPAVPTDNQVTLNKDDVGKVVLLLGDLRVDGSKSTIWNAKVLELMEPSRAIIFWLTVQEKNVGQFFPAKNLPDF